MTTVVLFKFSDLYLLLEQRGFDIRSLYDEYKLTHDLDQLHTSGFLAIEPTPPTLESGPRPWKVSPPRACSPPPQKNTAGTLNLLRLLAASDPEGHLTLIENPDFDLLPYCFDLRDRLDRILDDAQRDDPADFARRVPKSRETTSSP